MNKPLKLDERTVFTIVALLGVVLVSHLPVFSFGLLYDDRPTVVYNAFTTRLLNLFDLLTGVAQHQGVPDAHHPFMLVTSTIDRVLFGLSPTGHHVQSVLWHGLNTLLVAGLCWRLLGNRIRAGLAAAVFAIMPAHAAAVTVVSQREYVLATTAVLSAMLALSARRPLLAALVVTFGCWAHETTLLVLLLWPILVWMRGTSGPDNEPPRWRELRHDGAWLAAGGVVALGLRWAWAGDLLTALGPRQPGLIPDFWTSLGHGLRTGLVNMGQLVLPIGLGAVHPRAVAPWPLHLEWIVLAVLVAAIVIALRKKVDRMVVGCLVLSAVSLFPLLGPWQDPQIWADQQLYLPTVWTSLLLGHLLTRFAWPRPGRYAVVGVVLAALLIVHHVPQGYFRDEHVVGIRAFEQAPDTLRTWQGRAAWNLQLGNVDAATQNVKRGRSLDARDPILIALEGVITCLQGDPDSAQRLFAAARREYDRPRPRLLLQRAGCALRWADHVRAYELAGEASRAAPWMADPHSIRGLAMRAMGHFERAEEELLLTVNMAPDRPEFWGMLADLYEYKGRYDRADWARQQGGLPPDTSGRSFKWYQQPPPNPTGP